jgi:hypothetical protein
LFQKRSAAVVVGAVSPDLVLGAEQARILFSAKFRELGASSGDMALQLIRTTEIEMKSLDADWGFEMCLVTSLCGEKSEDRLIANMLAHFPEQGKPLVTVETTISDISRMPQQDVFRLASISAQNKHTLCLKMLGRLIDGRAPDFATVEGDKSMLKIVLGLENFVQHEVAASSTAAGKCLYGAAALSATFAKTMELSSTDNVDKELEQLNAFRWLIKPEDLDAVNDFIKDRQPKRRGAPVDSKLVKSAKNDKAIAAAMKMFEAES